MKYKRTLIILIAMLFLCGIVPSICFAWTNGCPRGDDCSFPGRCGRYIDNDGNGLCDLGESSSAGNTTIEESASTESSVMPQNTTNSGVVAAIPDKEDNTGSPPGPSPGSNSLPLQEPPAEKSVAEASLDKDAVPPIPLDAVSDSALAVSVSEAREIALPEDAANAAENGAGWMGYLEMLYAPNIIGISILLTLSYLVVRFRFFDLRFYIMLAAFLFLGFYLQGCICPIGAFVNISGILTDGFSVTAFYWLLLVSLPILFVLAAGRIFCSHVCPIGAFQELVYRLARRLKLSSMHYDPNKYNWLIYIKYFMMSSLVVYGLFFGYSVFCDYEPFLFLFTGTGGVVALVLLLGVIFFSAIIKRPWCRVLCPYGALLAIVSWISNKGKHVLGIKRAEPEIDGESCTGCRRCESKCPAGAISDSIINITECFSCQECVRACRIKAISRN